MNISLSTIEKGDSERLILITAVGLLESLEKNILTIEDCEQYLFSPYTVEVLKQKQVDEKVIQIIDKGLYLEDYESLLPDEMLKYTKSLKQEALELIKSREVPKDLYDIKKWIDD